VSRARVTTCPESLVDEAEWHAVAIDRERVHHHQAARGTVRRPDRPEALRLSGIHQCKGGDIKRHKRHTGPLRARRGRRKHALRNGHRIDVRALQEIVRTLAIALLIEHDRDPTRRPPRCVRRHRHETARPANVTEPGRSELLTRPFLDGSGSHTPPNARVPSLVPSDAGGSIQKYAPGSMYMRTSLMVCWHFSRGFAEG
jgi:hypothetical protein